MSGADLPTPGTYDPTARVSFSSMTSHRACPQAWSYRYIRGLTSTKGPGARDLGSWWHFVRAASSIDRGARLGSLKVAPDKLTTGDAGPELRLVPDSPGYLYRLRSGLTVRMNTPIALAISAAWWRTLSGEDKDAWIEAIGEALPDRLAYMSDRYDERWAEDTGHEVPLAVEFKFERELPGTRAVLPGVIDLVYLDTRRGLVVCRDHKTGKTLPAAEAAEDLSDSQLHLYAYGASPAVEAWSGHGPITALSYDRVRSVAPKAPAVTTTGTLSKSVTDYDLWTYVNFAEGPDGTGVPWGEDGATYKTGKRAGEPKWGSYLPEPAVVEKLSSIGAQSIWHQRTLTPINRNIIGAHLRAMTATHAEAVRTAAFHAKSGDAPRNFHRYLCGWCDYAKLCRAELVGGAGGSYDPAEFGLTLTYPRTPKKEQTA